MYSYVCEHGSLTRGVFLYFTLGHLSDHEYTLQKDKCLSAGRQLIFHGYYGYRLGLLAVYHLNEKVYI